MTLPMDVSRQHADGIKALVDGALVDVQVEGRYRVYVGEVTTAEADVTYPYVVIWPAPATRQTNTIAGYDGAVMTTTQITAAGSTVDEVLAALDRVADALHRRRPTIPGRTCGLLTQVPGATPPQPDRDDRVHTPGGRPVFFSFVLFQLYSTPAGGPT